MQNPKHCLRTLHTTHENTPVYGNAIMLTCGDGAPHHGRGGVPGPLRGLAQCLQAGDAAGPKVGCLGGLVLGLALGLRQSARQVLGRRGRQPGPWEAARAEDAEHVPQQCSARRPCTGCLCSSSLLLLCWGCLLGRLKSCVKFWKARTAAYV